MLREFHAHRPALPGPERVSACKLSAVAAGAWPQGAVLGCNPRARGTLSYLASQENGRPGGSAVEEDWSRYQSNMFTYAFLKIKSICAKTKEYKI